LLFFSESGCKGKNFKAYLPNIFGSFFSFFLFSLSSSSLLSKGRQKEKGRRTRHRFLKEECQLAQLSFSKAGAKVRTLKHNFQMFRKFFSLFFSKAEVPKETYGKEEKNGSLPLRFTVRMSKHRRLRSRKRMQK